MTPKQIASHAKQKGSSLIAVIVITVVSITVIGAMVILVAIVLYSTLGWQRSGDALFVAESYADDYLLRLVRSPGLTPHPTESLELNNAIAYPTLYQAPAGQPNTLYVKGVAQGQYVRVIKLVYVVENGKVTVMSREEAAP